MRMFHGLSAYRGGYNYLEKAITAVQGVVICTSDLPVGEIDLVVSGENTAYYSNDCWSQVGDWREVKDYENAYLNNVEGEILDFLSDYCAIAKINGNTVKVYDYDENFYGDYQKGIDKDVVYFSVPEKLVQINHCRVSDIAPITYDKFIVKNRESYGEVFTRVSQVHDVWVTEKASKKQIDSAKKIAEMFNVDVITIDSKTSIFDIFEYDYI